MSELGFSPELMNNSPKFKYLVHYEDFVSQDWIHPVGTDEAQLHVRGKLDEEAHEAADALRSGNPILIIDELGDFLWTADANAINAGITLESCLMNELLTEQTGTSPISIDRIDELALELIPDESKDVMADWINYLGYYLGKASKQWRALSPLIDPDSPPQGFCDAWILLKRQRAYDGLTQALLVTSAVAQRHAGKTLKDVMEHNAEKICSRKQFGNPVTTPPKYNN